MISPPRRGEPYPGRLPPVRDQWAHSRLGLRVAVVAFPVVLVAIVSAISLAAGVTTFVLVLGVAAATAMFAKNRTDRHNAAVDRGDIAVVADPHFRTVPAGDLDPDGVERLTTLGFSSADIGVVQRFDGGWLVKRRSPKGVAAVIGDDGGCAQFDPRSTTDLWAATEYMAGRGREAFSL